jgi:probable O-glycosylation ligase (exosortase A-associated)
VSVSRGPSVARSGGAEWWRPAVTVGSDRTDRIAPPAKDGSLPFSALLIFTLAELLAPQAFVPMLARVHIVLLAGAFALAVHCWTRFVARRPLFRPTRELWLVGMLLGWAIATLPVSTSPSESVGMLLDVYLKTLIFFWLVSNAITTLAQLHVMAWALSLVTGPMAATGIWNFLTHRLVVGRIFGYNAGLTSQPNDLALMLNLILPLTVALLLISRRPLARGLLVSLIALNVCAIIVTFSRAGFMSLVTTVVLYLWTLRTGRERRWAILAAVLAVATLPQLVPGYFDRLGTITNIQADQTYSAQNRTDDTLTALTFVLSHPLVGAGFGMSRLALNELHESSGQPGHNVYIHNVYLEHAMDLGLPGLALFLLLLVSCTRNAARIRDCCSGVPALRGLSSLAEASRIALVTFAISGFFYPVAYHPYFYIVAALAVAIGIVHENEALPERSIAA